jgi:hypothetical protein
MSSRLSLAVAEKVLVTDMANMPRADNPLHLKAEYGERTVLLASASAIRKREITARNVHVRADIAGHASSRRMISEAFVPPKPNELDSTESMVR